ncbi:8-amino-7-oxononanoate synthase [Solimonas sp. K1W22B-7]|nr:8-amino-7-oxononanoate synthase [Solimonas sp. K1W22B-7]
MDARLRVELEALRQRALYRTRRVIEGAHGVTITVNGRECLNFCSNDYLGLAADPRVAAAAKAALDAGGTGSGAAALISGYNREHQALEEELADFLGRPRALLFSSGWAANLGVIRALAGRGDSVIADELNHASLIDGGRLSGAQYLRANHVDLNSWAVALVAADGEQRLAVTDSVFSMDGDLAPLPQLAQLCATRNATLMVDDAHGFGVLGEHGEGAVNAAGLSVDEVPVYVATLGKSLGCSGAFVAGSEMLIEYLVQRARTWVFSTAPPPAIAAAARRALRIVRDEPEHRQRLQDNVRRFRAGARQLGIPLSESETPIQPLLMGQEQRALDLSQRLFDRGYWVAAIRPPTVPHGTSRLRITFSAAHTAEQIDGLLEGLAAGLK